MSLSSLMYSSSASSKEFDIVRTRSDFGKELKSRSVEVEDIYLLRRNYLSVLAP